VGGGIDFFFARAAALDIALRYHMVPDIDIGFDNDRAERAQLSCARYAAPTRQLI